MTSQLSFILSQITQPSGQAAPSTANVAGQLSLATRLTTAAEVIIARLPQSILAIKSHQQTVANIQLPPSLTLPKSATLQLAVLNQGTNTSPTAIISTQNSGAQSAPQTPQQLALISKELASLIVKSTQVAATIPATVSSINDASLSLNLPKGGRISLPVERQNASNNPLLTEVFTPGKKVNISISGDGNSNIKVTVAPQEQTSSLRSQTTINGTLSLGTTNKAGEANLQSLIIGALKHKGVAFNHSNTVLPPTIARNIPPIAQGNTVQQASHLTLQGETLKSVSAVTNVLAKAPLPSSLQGVLQSNMANALLDTASFSKKALSDKVPNAQILATPSPVDKTNNGAITEPDITGKSLSSTGNATQLKGSDIHQTILAVSRTLLSQSGSTQQALTQLLSVLSGKGDTSANSETLSPHAQRFISKMRQHIDSLHAKVPATRSNALPPHTEATITPAHSELTAKEVTDEAAATNAKALPQERSVKHTLGQLANLLLSSVNKPKPQVSQGSPGQAQYDTNKVSDALSSGPQATNSVADTHSENSTSTPNHPDMVKQDANLASRIQIMLLSPALLATPTTLNSPIAASNFVQGLVALLQVSLAGRALQRQPSLKAQIDLPDSIISRTLGATTNTQGATSRVAQDFANLDSRTNILNNLKTLLANHQQHKVSQVESRIQGQDNFYYILPSVSQHTAAPELLIQREPDHHGAKGKDRGKQSLWHVTMKLDIGEIGEVLAKSKIKGDTITLDLYASNQTIVARIGDTLPYLKQRLAELGLEVASSSFQQGSIPTTLSTRPHSIFETRV
ncbi:flagellar hook-length control protein FliK [Alteromonas sp. B31-7]|uniref:flagellar hook-length control protein FliK n=1 Tax=Alteromonas sp. B31-7 TaxID=2785913 RepID=UPI0018C9429D|nr:flagellar hook-length control protein FliK [Alteromonas sp. B31-7]QPL49242.1 flagellar hook-length control protein FliK [Alteromonas sp. B31-7]